MEKVRCWAPRGVEGTLGSPCGQGNYRLREREESAGSGYRLHKCQVLGTHRITIDSAGGTSGVSGPVLNALHGITHLFTKQAFNRNCVPHFTAEERKAQIMKQTPNLIASKWRGCIGTLATWPGLFRD